MNIEILLNGQSVVKLDFDLPALARIIQHDFQVDSNAQSTPATQRQLRDLLTRIDSRSVQFLKQIAASEDGSITWQEMRSIFGIKQRDDWAAYSGSFGKGITRAYRHILGDKIAKLVWWNDPDWDDVDWDDDMCAVFIDGPALHALRAAVTG